MIKKIAWKFDVTDKPGASRKIHPQPKPLLGGVAIFLSFLIVLIIAWLAGWLDDSVITNSQIWAVILGGSILIIGGILLI